MSRPALSYQSAITDTMAALHVHPLVWCLSGRRLVSPGRETRFTITRVVGWRAGSSGYGGSGATERLCGRCMQSRGRVLRYVGHQGHRRWPLSRAFVGTQKRCLLPPSLLAGPLASGERQSPLAPTCVPREGDGSRHLLSNRG